jgi:ribosome-binding protein aMBF1 (putative translation factor)
MVETARTALGRGDADVSTDVSTDDIAVDDSSVRKGGGSLAQSPRSLTPGRDARSFFGAELRHWRELRGLSQDRLGTEVHISGDMVAKIEKALRWPHREFAATCDDVLETGGALGRIWPLVDVERRPDVPHFSGPIWPPSLGG